jgi:hypothetical protein
MLWKDAKRHDPERPGQFYVWHPRLGKVVMGWNQGWGGQPPLWWLCDDQCGHQGLDGSFDGRVEI